MLSSFSMKFDSVFPKSLPPGDYSPQFANEFNDILRDLNTFITYHSGVGLISPYLRYIQNMHLAVFPLYKYGEKIPVKAFEELICAMDKIYLKIPQGERKAKLIPALKQAIIVLGAAITHLEEKDSEKYISSMKKYIRYLNTLGVQGNPEDYRTLSRDFCKELAKDSLSENFRSCFLEQAADWDTFKVEEVTLSETNSQDSAFSVCQQLINRGARR